MTGGTQSAPRRWPGGRRVGLGLLAVACAAVGLAGLLTGPGSTAVPTALVEAADTSQFRAGNIISDQLFYDGNAMSAADVQTFLQSKNPNCKPSSAGVPCLKNATQDTDTRPADSRCPGTYVGAPAESAATIIAKVGKACGISQRVLLVILQKEQGLVTLSGDKLTVTRYEKAMGFGCPDTKPCDPKYAHLFNQLYSAAWQYRNYVVEAHRYNHKVGIVNNVRYDVETACGSSPVFIENQATAGLYNYTPYQPNDAALRAGSGTGDGCSAYGNRNFWIYYTDWFGSTQVPGAAQVTGRYAATGGATGPLGAIRDGVACGLAGGGCLQAYAHGSIYWSQATGARIVLNGAVRDKWGSTGWEGGALGYPVQDAACGLTSGGCFQAFQRGSVYWSQSSGAHVVSGAVRDRWGVSGWEYGSLGYPVVDQ
ncbi:LGFP repeat-containing protein, partial [Modestobacter sp. SYSU DS0875]